MNEPVSSNPLKILCTLDKFLKNPFELIVYGRSALVLGYPEVPGDYYVTMDVDAILPARDLEAIETNEDFWQAQDKTNAALSDAGLYFTHLFEEKQVVLSPQWLENTVTITHFDFCRLSLKRPSTHDLILTKMMRVDPQDRDDIRFLLKQQDFDRQVFIGCLKTALCPPVPEIQQAFASNKSWMKSLLPDT